MALEKYVEQNQKDTRSGFGEAMVELGRKNPNVIALCADLTGSLKLEEFEKEFPDRFIQCGIAEANMIGISAGLAIDDKIPFATTFANFGTGRVYDQIRQSVAYSGKNVKICCSHAGLTLGEDGATHQILEDIGLMQMLPGFTVINPCDFNQTKLATLAIADHVGPVYLRFGRPKWPNFTPLNEGFEIGKAILMQEGNDVTIIATGHMVWKSIEATKALQEKGIQVELINIHTIKPLDETAVLNSVRKTKCVVIAEEHQKLGGLGATVSQLLSQQFLCPAEFVAVNDSFGQSGTPDQLMTEYGLDSKNVIEAAMKAISRK